MGPTFTGATLKLVTAATGQPGSELGLFLCICVFLSSVNFGERAGFLSLATSKPPHGTQNLPHPSSLSKYIRSQVPLRSERSCDSQTPLGSWALGRTLHAVWVYWSWSRLSVGQMLSSSSDGGGHPVRHAASSRPCSSRENGADASRGDSMAGHLGCSPALCSGPISQEYTEGRIGSQTECIFWVGMIRVPSFL